MNNSEKVLVVDDDEKFTIVLKSTLKKQGYEIVVALSGKEALRVVKTEKPDLILLDVMMKELDGYAVCKSLKADTETQNIPIIFLTMKTAVNDIIKGFDSGGVDYITKPFNTAELQARVKTHIELKKAREELKLLRGILPICADCKKIRDDKGYWKQVEVYISENSDAVFTHSICPDCAQELYPDLQLYKHES
ncbi:MAG: response regulator [bacterium]|nr:response regulator [bacterium]